MQKIPLIIINGLPGSGKTTLAQKLSKHYSTPLFTKDIFKEVMFDTLGYSDREWSKKVGIAAYTLMYTVAKEVLKNGKGCIIDSNFSPLWDNSLITNLFLPHVVPIQIVLYANGQVLLDRVNERYRTTKRHPGHIENEALIELRDYILQGKIQQLSINNTLEIDTHPFNENIEKQCIAYINKCII